MTTFEHALLGINGVLAAGLDRRHGWGLAAMAGVAAVLPDWDGVSVLWSAALFDQGHRVWGHNVFVCSLIGLLFGLADWKMDLVTRCGRGLAKLFRVCTDGPTAVTSDRPFVTAGLVWLGVALVASWSHLVVDLMFSGHSQLSDWELQLFWPISNRGFVYPLVPWGDIGATVVFVLGMFALLRWPARRQVVAGLTLVAVFAYIVVRGFFRTA